MTRSGHTFGTTLLARVSTVRSQEIVQVAEHLEEHCRADHNPHSIVDPNNKTKRDAEATPAVDFSAIFKHQATKTEAHDSNAEHTPPVTPVSASPAPRPTIPYVKQPVYMDYGLRVKIAPTTFINRNCTILDTPVADIVIGEQCSLGPGVTIIGVGHPVRFEERSEFITGKPGSWGARVVIGDGVWVGAGVTVLPGVTIGSYSTIGAGSVVTRDVPASCVAMGNPASVRYYVDSDKGREPVVVDGTANTLEDALKVDREEQQQQQQGGEVVKAGD